MICSLLSTIDVLPKGNIHFERARLCIKDVQRSCTTGAFTKLRGVAISKMESPFLKLVNLQEQPSSNDGQVAMSRVASNSNHLFFSLPVRRRPLCACATFLPPSPYPCPVPPNSFSTSSSPHQDDLAATASEHPRWRATPSRMVNRGTSHRFLRNSRPFTVNEDPEKLDEVLTRVLGTYGDRMLTEEVKWLTVTHKSFDHGRRGFNDRLAYLGTLDSVYQYWATSADTWCLQANESSIYKLHYTLLPLQQLHQNLR